MMDVFHGYKAEQVVYLWKLLGGPTVQVSAGELRETEILVVFRRYGYVEKCFAPFCKKLYITMCKIEH